MVPIATRCAILNLGEFLGPKQAQLIVMHSYDFSDEGRAIEELVVRWVLLNLIPRVLGQKRRQLASPKNIK